MEGEIVVIMLQVDGAVLLAELQLSPLNAANWTVRLSHEDGEEEVGAGHHLGLDVSNAVQGKVVSVVEIFRKSETGEPSG